MTFKPKVDIKDGKINLSLLTLGNQASVRILNAQNEVIFTELFQNTPTVNKIYSVESLYEKGLTFEVVNQGKVFYFEIN
jgi:hypothetical protein